MDIQKKEMISVIVPVYNVENYLTPCLRSLTEQSYRNLQILLIDDGSTDHSGKICDEFSALDERIQVVHCANSGVSAARNVGLTLAKGDYIAFADADDILPAGAYDRLIAGAKSGCDLMIGRLQTMTQEGIPLDLSRAFAFTKPEREAFLFDLFREEVNSYLGFPWDKLYKRELIEKYQLRFDPEIQLNEDRVFVLRYVLKCETIGACDDCVYLYRQKSADVVSETGRSLVVTQREMTVLKAFDTMKQLCKAHSPELYYLCSRKAFESAIDLLSRVSAEDTEKRTLLKSFLRANARICLAEPGRGPVYRCKIIAHCIFGR